MSRDALVASVVLACLLAQTRCASNSNEIDSVVVGIDLGTTYSTFLDVLVNE